MDNCQTIINNREWTKAALESMGFTVLKSSANFLFASSDKIDGGELYLQLKKKGILVRHFKKERISNFVRISIGKQEDMEILINSIRLILEEVKL